MRIKFRLLIAFAFISVLCFQKAAALNYYWIGNGGNWTDLSHWATTSGGSVTHNQIPTAADDVFFDANSFTLTGQTVTVNALTALVHDMNWTGVINMPTFKGAYGNTLKIYGSLKFTAGMAVDFSGAVNFDATVTTNTIAMGGNSFKGSVSFNGTNAGWTLQDDFATTSSFTFNSGVFSSNNFNVSGNSFTSSGTLARTLNMGSSQFTFNGNGTVWYISGSGITINAGTSAINLSGTVIPYFFGDVYQYYDLNFTAPGANTGAQTFGNSRFHNVTFYSSGTVVSDTIVNLTFKQNGNFSASATCQNLILTPGYSYKFSSASVQKITGSINAAGDCGDYISLGSNVEGTQATINHTGAIAGSFLILKDIKATGGGSFTASNSIDLGNNAGCTISAGAVSNLYWVGNGGNWSDGNHWSLTSGGAASGCSPTPLTNVFFDANSFSTAAQSVVLDVPAAYCRDMNWTGAANTPTFSGNAANGLKIYGSLSFTAAMNVTYSNLTSFEATTAGNTITTAGKTFPGYIYFNGSGGTYSLQDNFSTQQSITLNAGTLTTNSNTVSVYGFYSSSSGIRSLNLGASVINITGSSSSWSVSSSGFTLNAGTSTINVKNSYNNFDGGGLQYYDLNFIDTTAGSYAYINGANTFHNVVFRNTGTIQSANTFQNLTFERNATLNSNNSIGNLQLTGGYTYQLKDGTNQTISGNLIANGNCGALINIASVTSGTQATITKTTGVINTDYLVLKDIKATGGATFNVSNLVDLGNNTGWNVTSLTGKNYYWIGDAGNWSDGNHWSLTSGGVPSGCLPTPLDNVFFDANSFSLPAQTVNIDVPVAYCRDISWTGATGIPKLSGPGSNRLKIFGSLTFITDMSFPFAGMVDFQSNSTGNTITTAALSFKNSVYFIGVGGGWTLLDSLTTTNSIYLNNGTLNTNDQKVKAYAFYSTSNQARTLNMGASVFTLSAAASFWSASATGFTLNSGTSHVIGTHDVIPTFDGGGLQYYDLTFSSINSSGAYLNGNNNFHNVVFKPKGIVQGTNSFNELRFLNDGNLANNNTFTNLILTAEYTYTFAAGKTQTIINRMQAQGTCTSYLILNSSIPGAAAFVNKASGEVLGFNIHMKDITGNGGAIFYAYNSVNLGNNAGWNFTILPTLLPPNVVVGPASVCAGATDMVYHTSPVSGAIFYEWSVPSGATITAGQGDTTITVNFGTASTGSVSVLTYNGCNYNTTGSSLTTVIMPALPPAIAITANPATPVCSGIPVVFTTTVTNTGSNTITYNFKVNGVSVQNSAASSYILNTPADGDMVSCDIVTSGSTACSGINTATSDTFQVVLSNVVSNPAVSIAAAPSGTVCNGTPVTVTATAVNTGGGSVNYHFKLNGISVQNSGSNAYTISSLANTDMLSCEIKIAGGNCIATDTAVSNTITVSVSPAVVSSVSISTADTNTCAGSAVSFAATAVNGGTAPAYQWMINGTNVGANADNFTSSSIADGDIISCQLTSNIACGTNAPVLSNSIAMHVSPVLNPSVSIAASANNVCAGTSISFTATGVDGGVAPVYQWKINGTDAGTNSNIYTNTAFNNADVVTCVFTSSAGCVSANDVLSNAVTMDIFPNVIPSVAITASNNIICPGATVSFVATAENPGTSPVYQWKINGVNVGGNSNRYSSGALNNNDVVTCSLLSDAPCAAAGEVLSNAITITVLPLPSPSVSISTATNAICSGQAVTFTANSIDTGASPVYQWQVNGLDAGANSSSFTSSSLTNGDVVSCNLSSSMACAAPVSSNSIVMQVTTAPPASVSITASANNICEGKKIVFTAAANNAGTNPVYQWKINGIDAGANSTSFQPDIIHNNDVVTNELLVNTGCYVNSKILSNAVTMHIYTNPQVTIEPSESSILYGRSIQLQASATGNAVSYVWNNSATLNNAAIANPVAKPDADITYTLKVTTAENCVGYASATVKVLRGIYIPGSFTPNNDGKNDVFRIPPSTAINQLQYFIVYDRFGNIVFETKDIRAGWDGRFKGKDAPIGNYVYIIKANSLRGETVLKGSVLLTR